MAEKKFGLGTVLLIGAAAAAVAGGVVSYIKRAEIKMLAEDIIAKVKPADEADGETGDWDIRAGAAEVDAADVNIVDSGISLESVENPEDTAEAETESEPEADAEPEPEAEEAAGEAEAVEEAGSEPDVESEPEPEQPKKKTWFWSK